MEIMVCVGSAVAAFTAGFAAGKQFGTKTITTDKGWCTVPKEHGEEHGAPITKIYTNGKCSDVTCSRLGENSVCRVTGKTCRYLS